MTSCSTETETPSAAAAAAKAAAAAAAPSVKTEPASRHPAGPISIWGVPSPPPAPVELADDVGTAGLLGAPVTAPSCIALSSPSMTAEGGGSKGSHKPRNAGRWRGEQRPATTKVESRSEGWEWGRGGSGFPAQFPVNVKSGSTAFPLPVRPAPRCRPFPPPPPPPPPASRRTPSGWPPTWPRRCPQIGTALPANPRQLRQAAAGCSLYGDGDAPRRCRSADAEDRHAGSRGRQRQEERERRYRAGGSPSSRRMTPGSRSRSPRSASGRSCRHRRRRSRGWSVRSAYTSQTCRTARSSWPACPGTSPGARTTCRRAQQGCWGRLP